jgi:hypothetical protein
LFPLTLTLSLKGEGILGENPTSESGINSILRSR